MKLPVIDFSNLKQDETDPTTLKSQQVFNALEEYGCFEARFDQIPRIPVVFDGLPQLFDLPLETKQRNKTNLPYYNGYMAKTTFLPLYESLGISDVLKPGKIETFTNLMWPQQGNPTFSTNVESLYDQLWEIDKMVRRMVVERLGLGKYMDEHMDSTEYLIRFMKYYGPQTHEAKLGLLPHADKNIVTILSENGVSGLQVQTKGGEWISVEPSPGSFIVLIGESLHAWTNGRVYCPNHRVMMSGDEARYSVALFSYPKPGYVVKSPEEIVDEEHPLLFKPFKYLDFLHFHRSEAGQSSGSYPLKSYCGV